MCVWGGGGGGGGGWWWRDSHRNDRETDLDTMFLSNFGTVKSKCISMLCSL